MTFQSTPIDDLQINSTEEASIKFENGKWLLTGEKVGVATITLSSISNDITKTYSINIMPIKVTSIEFNTIPDSIIIDTEYSFNIIVSPENATDKSFTITHSENIELSNIMIEGIEYYQIIGKVIGDAWIKVITNDGSVIENTKILSIIST